MKKMIAMAVVCVAGGAFATVANDAMTNDPQVVMTRLNVNQRYPWNGKVDIDFAFTCAIPEAFAFVQFKATYLNKAGETVEVPMKTFDQVSIPWCTNAGMYHVTWDAAADAPNLTVTNLRYTVTANMAKYMVVDLSKGKGGPFPISYYDDVPSFPGVEAGKWDDYHKTTNLVLRLIQPGTYRQGWTDSTSTSTKREGYAHTATLTKPFYMAVFELTQEQMLLIRGNRGQNTFSGGRRAMRPAVENYQNLRGKGYQGTINFPATGSIVAETSVLHDLRQAADSDGFDLPTETEWEYACRCGSLASGFWNDGSDAGIDVTTKASTISNGVGSAVALDTLGRYQDNGGMVKTWDEEGQTNIYTAAALTSDESLGTAVVGSYKPNAWGLYDMHGNAEEWTNGAWPGSFQYSASTNTVDDVGPVSATWGQWGNRIVRGGNCKSPARYCAIHRRLRDGSQLYERSYMEATGIRLIWRFWIPPQLTEE